MYRRAHTCKHSFKDVEVSWTEDDEDDEDVSEAGSLRAR